MNTAVTTSRQRRDGSVTIHYFRNEPRVEAGPTDDFQGGVMMVTPLDVGQSLTVIMPVAAVHSAGQLMKGLPTGLQKI
jgi:hypothetical protein